MIYLGCIRYSLVYSRRHHGWPKIVHSPIYHVWMLPKLIIFNWLRNIKHNDIRGVHPFSIGVLKSAPWSNKNCKHSKWPFRDTMYTQKIITCLKKLQKNMMPGVAPPFFGVSKSAPWPCKHFKQSKYPPRHATNTENHHLVLNIEKWYCTWSGSNISLHQYIITLSRLYEHS